MKIVMVWLTGGYWHNGRESNSHRYKVTQPANKDNLEGNLKRDLNLFT